MRTKVEESDLYYRFYDTPYTRKNSYLVVKGSDGENAFWSSQNPDTPLATLIDIANADYFDFFREFLLANPKVPTELRVEWALKWSRE